MKKHVLFVDDEPNVLDGLRRMLRSMRQEWEMTFARGSEEALAALAARPFEVIVSDMRMPGVYGAELLERVKRDYPQVVRIGFSGQTSDETILRAVGPTHQYLSKPCDAKTLRATINRVCSLRGMLANEKLQGLISQLESLPCMSSLYSELMEELQSEETSVEKVGKIISQDVGMSAKILQLVNSAFFGVRQHISNISQAVSLLGLKTTKALVLCVKIFSQFDPTNVSNFSIDDLWSHSLTVGECSRMIAEAETKDPKVADCALVAGTLHDVGKLILATIMPQEYQRVLSEAGNENPALSEAERRVMDITHAEVGAYLLGLWGFSNPIVEAVAFHHRPGETTQKTFAVLTVVHVANILSHELVSGDKADTKGQRVDRAYLEETGSMENVAAWRDLCLDKLKVKS